MPNVHNIYQLLLIYWVRTFSSYFNQKTWASVCKKYFAQVTYKKNMTRFYSKMNVALFRMENEFTYVEGKIKMFKIYNEIRYFELK